jgi:hypothetical protein
MQDVTDCALSRQRNMEKTLILVVSTIGSSAGWWVGGHIGMMTAFICSIIGLAVGVWGGRRLANEWVG